MANDNMPQAVVVDLRNGDTIHRSPDGKLLTALTATLFAAKCNNHCKPEFRTYHAFRLTPI